MMESLVNKVAVLNTKKKCLMSRVQHEATREKMKYERSATRKKVQLENDAQHERSVTWRKCNMKSVQHLKRET